mgnify:CR=1 FL=1
MIQPRIFKGARDFLPEQMLHRERILEIMRKTFKKYGYAPVETPAIEYLDILTGKYGDLPSRRRHQKFSSPEKHRTEARRAHRCQVIS